MKKTLKAFIASILVISMLFCSVSASAISFIPTDSDINASIPNAAFTPDETGYYISADTIRQDWNYPSYVTVKDGEKKVYLYYLEKDKSYSSYGNAPEFLGAEIDRISATDPSVFNNFILGVDIEEGDTSISFDTPVGIVFGGKTVYTYSTTLVCENGITAGENEVKFDILNYEETKTLNVYTLDEVIQSVEIKNKSFYLSAFVDYEGAIFVEDISNAVIVINGTQEIVANEYGYFVYSSRRYPVSVERVFDEEGTPVKTNVYISGELGKTEIALFDLETVEANDTQNIMRATYYSFEKIEALKEEMIEKYSAYPLSVQNLMIPVMLCEMWIKGMGILFNQMKANIRILFS